MFAAALFTLALLAGGSPQAGEVIAQIQVHGNTVTPESEILALAAVGPGTPLAEDTVALIEQRLHESRRFEAVEVRKRLASIADPTQVLLVIIVDEGRVGLNWNREPGEPVRAERRRGLPFMLAPVLDADDGYGVTYGGRVAFPGIAGAQSLLKMPLTWGGEKQAALEFDKQFADASRLRVTGGVLINRRTNPHFEADDTRTRVWARVERPVVSRLRAGATISRERARFQGASETFASAGLHAAFDTRLDPFLARNAVYARAAVERVALASPLLRTELEAQGHVGMPGQSVLVLRAQRESADRSQPAYLKPLMGGARNLRGFEAGHAAGDTLVAATAEIRVPLTSPLNVGKLGVSAFYDAAASYDAGERLEDQRFERGIGGSVWVSLAVFRMELSAARGVGHATRVHFDATVTF